MHKSKLARWMLLIGILIVNNSAFAQTFMENNCDGYINCMFADTTTDELYISCLNYNNDGTKNTSISKWDGNDWTSIAADINGEIKTIIKMNDTLIIAGSFSEIDGNSINNIAFFNGTVWYALGGGLGNDNNCIYSLCYFDGNLIAGGDFISNDHNTLFKLYGTSWVAFPQKIYGLVLSICNFNDTLFMAGNFERIDTTIIFGFAKLSDTTWLGIPDTINGSISGMISYSGTLYLSGMFISSNTSSSFIASFDGMNLQPLGQGINSMVSDMYLYNNKLYITGEFTEADSLTVQKIASWDGSSWAQVDLGNDISNVEEITCLVSYNNLIIIGGKFYDNASETKRLAQLSQ